MKNVIKSTIIILMCLGLFFSNAYAGEITLKAVSAFTENTAFSKGFENFIKKVNAEGKGLVQINYLGGGSRIMSPFEVGNAVRTGVVDIGNLTGAFYTNLLPESNALKLCQVSPTELREKGGKALIERLHNEKVNAHYLAWQGYKTPFHLYLTKPLEKPDLTGYKLRVTPIYRKFFEAMGASAMRTPPGEIYTALERGVVDGYGWPILGIFDLGLQEVTKYRVDPGFYVVDVNVIVNLKKWNNKLNDEQRSFLSKMGLWLESENEKNDEIVAAAMQKQKDAGIKTIEFSGKDRDDYLQTAYKAAWDDVIKNSPVEGPKLKKLLSQ